MRKFRTKHRLVPLETLYPNRPALKPPKKVIPFIKPGVAAKIPTKTEEQPQLSITFHFAQLGSAELLRLAHAFPASSELRQNSVNSKSSVLELR